jgi:hypothetical protein
MKIDGFDPFPQLWTFFPKSELRTPAYLMGRGPHPRNTLGHGVVHLMLVHDLIIAPNVAYIHALRG